MKQTAAATRTSVWADEKKTTWVSWNEKWNSSEGEISYANSEILAFKAERMKNKKEKKSKTKKKKKSTNFYSYMTSMRKRWTRSIARNATRINRHYVPLTDFHYEKSIDCICHMPDTQSPPCIISHINSVHRIQTMFKHAFYSRKKKTFQMRFSTRQMCKMNIPRHTVEYSTVTHEANTHLQLLDRRSYFHMNQSAAFGVN